MSRVTTIGILTAVALALGSSACSTQPSGDPGLCALNCSNAIFGSNQFKVTAMSKLEYSCASRDNFGNIANSDRTITNKTDPTGFRSFESPAVIRFLVTKKSTIGSDSVERPVPGISFNPTVGGFLDQKKTSTDKLSDSRYFGVVTPPSDWCSDACGVVTITVWPYCLLETTNNVSVQLSSGSLFSDVATVSIQPPPKPDDSASLTDPNTKPDPFSPTPTPSPAVEEDSMYSLTPIE